jgi:hypothetical protein
MCRCASELTLYGVGSFENRISNRVNHQTTKLTQESHLGRSDKSMLVSEQVTARLLGWIRTTSFTGSSGIVSSASIIFSDTFSANVVKSWKDNLKSGSCTIAHVSPQFACKLPHA